MASYQTKSLFCRWNLCLKVKKRAEPLVFLCCYLGLETLWGRSRNVLNTMHGGVFSVSYWLSADMGKKGFVKWILLAFKPAKSGFAAEVHPVLYRSCESVLWTICYSRNLHLPCLNSNFVPLSLHKYFKIMVAEVLPNTNACVFMMCLFYWRGQDRLMLWAE